MDGYSNEDYLADLREESRDDYLGEEEKIDYDALGNCWCHGLKDCPLAN
jgi:hypothetical protein